MTRSIITAKSELNQASEHLKIAKAIITAHVQSARLLLDEDSLHSLKEVALTVANDVSTIETNLFQFQRTAFGSKRFEVKKEEIGV